MTWSHACYWISLQHCIWLLILLVHVHEWQPRSSSEPYHTDGRWFLCLPKKGLQRMPQGLLLSLVAFRLSNDQGDSLEIHKGAWLCVHYLALIMQMPMLLQRPVTKIYADSALSYLCQAQGQHVKEPLNEQMTYMLRILVDMLSSTEVTCSHLQSTSMTIYAWIQPGGWTAVHIANSDNKALQTMTPWEDRFIASFIPGHACTL